MQFSCPTAGCVLRTTPPTFAALISRRSKAWWLASGIKFNENRGAAYLKASYNHDFLGYVDAEYTAFDGSMNHLFKISDELDDNWAEVSLGFSYSVTDSFNTFLDVGTGFGGDIDQKWRVNFGGRYTF